MNRTKSLIAGVAMSGAALVGGAAALTVFQPASAQTATTTAPVTSGPAAGDPAASGAPKGDPSLGGHVGTSGVKEELLTGATADQAKAAALAAVPGGTVERVENDAEGSTYEAHAVTAEGKHVTVKMDANFAVTSTENGPR